MTRLLPTGLLRTRARKFAILEPCFAREDGKGRQPHPSTPLLCVRMRKSLHVWRENHQYKFAQCYNLTTRLSFGLPTLNWERFLMNLKVIWRQVPCSSLYQYLWMSRSWSVVMAMWFRTLMPLTNAQITNCKNVKYKVSFLCYKITPGSTYNPPHLLESCYAASFHESTATVEREWMLSPIRNIHQLNQATTSYSLE